MKCQKCGYEIYANQSWCYTNGNSYHSECRPETLPDVELTKLLEKKMETKEEEEQIKKIERKAVKDRTREEHRFLIDNKYKHNIRDYLLSMGKFKEDKQ